MSVASFGSQDQKDGNGAVIPEQEAVGVCITPTGINERLTKIMFIVFDQGLILNK